MKLLTITVPCYNSEAYMKRCINSLLIGGEDVEILIIDDGSTDQTATIADTYEAEYPTIVRAIHKENGGHGSGVNTGIALASGIFFKVVDSDDRVDPKAYLEILRFLREIVRSNKELDLLVSNYVYDKAGKKHKYVMKPKGLPKETFITWKDVKRIRKYHFILMHSIIYRTELLRTCGLRLPEHTFYVDNIYAFQPLPYVKTIYYKDVNFYWYYIGREGQSVCEEKMVAQIDQYIRVDQIMMQQYLDAQSKNTDPACLHYMLNYLEIILTITCNFLNVGKDPVFVQKKKNLWVSMYQLSSGLTKLLRHRLSLIVTNLPGWRGRNWSRNIYRVVTWLFGLN